MTLELYLGGTLEHVEMLNETVNTTLLEALRSGQN